jgi:hypothetical protein
VSMHVHFVKKLQFTKLVKAGGRLREFNFLKHNKEPEYFSVDTVDDRGNRITFFMYDTDGSWKIEAKKEIPQWILEAEGKLQQMIQEEVQ